MASQETHPRLKCSDRLGWALLSLQYIWPENCGADQLVRVQKLCEVFAEAWNNRPLDDPWWDEFYREVDEETENLC